MTGALKAAVDVTGAVTAAVHENHRVRSLASRGNPCD
jgi:hypothetical protein